MPVAPPPTTIDHQLTHWDENMSPDIVAVNVALIVLATIAVLSRLISRRIKAAPLQADDFMVMVSLFATYTLATEVILCASHGMGKHTVRVARSGGGTIVYNLKLQYAIEITWVICTILVKLSVLLLFDRLFSPTSPRFRLCLIIVAGFVFAWTFGSFFTAVFPCSPVHHFWDSTIKGSCPIIEAGRVATAVFNSATDVIMLILPVPMVWKLFLPLRQRMAVAAIFGVGAFCLAASAARLHYSAIFSIRTDPTYRNARFILWASVEPCAGIICACLPILRPISPASTFPRPIFPESSLRKWLNDMLHFLKICSLHSRPSQAKPKLDEREKTEGEANASATAPRSPNMNLHTSATYSQAVGRPCDACGGTGIEPPMDLEKGRENAKMKAVIAEFDENDGELREMPMTIHEVRRWGRESLRKSDIWAMKV